MRSIRHPAPDEFLLGDVLHALSDPVRLGIVRSLARSPGQPCGLLDLGVAKSTLSHHLKVLREAGVTQTRIDGTQRLVSVRADELDVRFPGLLDSVLRCAEASRPHADAA